MPARPTVTGDQVRVAATELRQAIQPVTGWWLRHVIGAGDPQRLAVLHAQLGTSNAESAAPQAEGPPLPPGLTAQVEMM